MAGYNDHGGLAYSTREERDAAAVEWLLEGAKLGQRLLAITADDDGGSRLLAAILAAPDARFLRENVGYFSIDDLYDLSRPIDAENQLAMYADQVERAHADGFNGLRVFCDITPLIADPARRASHAQWEHIADAWMAQGNSLAALCAYDVGVVGVQPQAVLAVHPLRHGPPGVAPFGLYWGPSGRVIEGEVDVFALRAFTDALAALPDNPVDLDADGLSFLCARAATTLARLRRGHDEQPQLRLIGAPRIVRRVWEALELEPGMVVGRPGDLLDSATTSG